MYNFPLKKKCFGGHIDLLRLVCVVRTGQLVSLEGEQGGAEGAAEVLVGAGEAGDDLQQTVGRLGEALCGGVKVRPADWTVV